MTFRYAATLTVFVGVQVSAVAVLTPPVLAQTDARDAVFSAPHKVAAQSDPRDTIQLSTLHAMAAQRDPRTRQIGLLAAQTELRLRNIGVEGLPAVTVASQSQYQSDVTTIPFQLPGVQRPIPPNDTYDARIEAQQRLIDPSVGSRKAVQRAELAASQARVRTAIYSLRENVNDAFFSAARLQLERGEIETSITDLEAQLRLADNGVRLGVSLPSEAATFQAEILERRQTMAEIDASRGAALTVLADLTGAQIGPEHILALPDVSTEVARARATLDGIRRRPEYEQYAREREVLQRQEREISMRDKPRLSAFVRGGYGQPGLNVLNTDFATYWLVGVQGRWTPWSWGTTRREREELALQRQIIETEEAAFKDRIERSTAYDLAAIDRLEAAIAIDDRIIALRERIARETLRRFQEGVVTSAEYVDRQTDVLNARLARASHHAELAQARVRFLTLVGLEVR